MNEELQVKNYNIIIADYDKLLLELGEELNLIINNFDSLYIKTNNYFVFYIDLNKINDYNLSINQLLSLYIYDVDKFICIKNIFKNTIKNYIFKYNINSPIETYLSEITNLSNSILDKLKNENINELLISYKLLKNKII